MYKIIGDGSWQHTQVIKNEASVNYKECIISVKPGSCYVIVDGITDEIDLILLNGLYKLISKGSFNNTKLFFNDDWLRGLQSLKVTIKQGCDPLFDCEGIFLPNIVENDEK